MERPRRCARFAGRVVATLLAAPLAPAAFAAGIGDHLAVPWNPPPLVELAPGETLPSPAELEAMGARIGRLEVRRDDIFDLADPRENVPLFRLGNRLHIKTREETVVSQLTFAPGEAFVERRLDESERVLRGRDYLLDAIVRPARYHPDTNTVDVEVSTKDVWTLNPAFNYNRRGGKRNSSIEIEEGNLLGRGKSVKVARDNGVDRDSWQFVYTDPNVWGSRWTSRMSVEDLSDGDSYRLDFDRPFYSLDTRWSAGFTAYEDDRVQTRYRLGEPLDAFRARRSFYEVNGGYSSGLSNGWVRRWLAGFRYDRASFDTEPGLVAPPALATTRQFVYPFVGVELVQERYVEVRNQDRIARTEDLDLGTRLRLEVGYASANAASTQSAVLFATTAHAGRKLGSRQQLFLNAAGSGRIESGELVNGVVSGSADWYLRFSRHHLIYASVRGAATERLDLDRQLVLGGEEGLRGFPLRFQSGTSRAMTTLEYRVYSDWYPFRLWHVGGAVFADAGRTWGRGPTGERSLGMLKDAGFGLRIGNTRSGLGAVLHVDFAWALDRPNGVDGFQINIDTKTSF